MHRGLDAKRMYEYHMGMASYFDNTFFKFFFGFLGILALSFSLVVATQYWSDRDNPERMRVDANGLTEVVTTINEE